MSTISGNLAAMAKDIDAAHKKTDKLKDKGAKAKPSAVGEAAHELQNAELQWDSQAPYVFEKLQAVDESRLNHLRDVLTQFQTHEVDQVERSRVTAEETLNVLLNIETADEIHTWALRARSRDFTQPTRKQTTAAAAPSATLAPPPTPPNPGPIDDSRSQKSQKSGSVQEKLSSNPLKRFGTVLNRRRQSIHPYGRPTSPDRKSSANLASAFGGFGKGKSKDRDTPAAPPSDRPVTPLRQLTPTTLTPDRSSSPNQTRFSSNDPPNGTAPDISSEANAPNAPNGTAHDTILEVNEPPPPSALPTLVETKPEVCASCIKCRQGAG